MSNPGIHTQLLAAAARALKANGADARQVQVSVRGPDGTLLRYSGTPPEGEDGPPQGGRGGWPASWRFFSPVAEKAIAALRARGSWMSSEELANALGETCNASFKGLLGDLTDRKVLESSVGRGYRLLTEPPRGEPRHKEAEG